MDSTGESFYFIDFPGEENISIIFNNNGASQTGDITGITETVYYQYDGGSTATKLDITPGPSKPVVRANPASGTTFRESVTVTLTATPAVNIRYTLDGTTPSASSALYSAPLTFTETTTLKTFVENENGSNVQTFTYTKSDTPAPRGYTVYFDNSNSRWSAVYAYVYGDGGLNDFVGKWPGKQMSLDAESGYYKLFIDTDKDLTAGNIIFTNNSGAQTGDNVKIVNNGIYNASGYTGETYTSGIADAAEVTDVMVWTAGGSLFISTPAAGPVTIYSVTGAAYTRYLSEGVNEIYDLPHGFYIVNRTKVIL